MAAQVWDGRLKCARPFMVGDVLPVACGRCPQCQAKRAAEHARRFEWEFDAAQGVASFVTLTYADAFVPSLGSLSRADLRGFRDRLGRSFGAAGIRLRMVAVGEYGDRTQRPHYHLILFGVNDVAARLHVESAWTDAATGTPRGHVQVQTIDGKSAVFRYVSSYVLKGWHRRDAEGLGGRLPEFMVWPRPSLGVSLVEAVADSLRDPVGGRVLASHGGDVPKFIIRGGRHVSLGDAMVSKLRHLLGLRDDGLAKLARRRLMRQRLAEAVREFRRKYPEGDWRSTAAHVDAHGLEVAAARRRFYGGAKKNGSL